jgi:hypothetical protein
LSTVLLALRRALIAYGPQDEERLRQLCAPEVEALGDPGMARRTLTRWTQLGVFEQTAGGRIALSAGVKAIEADDLKGLRAALLRIVLADSNNPALAPEVGEGEEERIEQSRAGDFTLATAWLLAQDPFTFVSTHPRVETLLAEQRVTVRLFSNNTRWNGFVEWATFLGVALYVSESLVLNPCLAVESALEEVFGAQRELPQREFLARLADAVPVLDGGRYRQIALKLSERPWHAFRENEVSPCLSLGLQTLVEKKILRLEPRSDAPQCMLLGRGGRDTFTFSHVVRVSP